jgi:hypothetical protein
MRLISGDEYQDRINPWLNKNMHIAHSIPISFPRFYSVAANEVFLFGVTALFFLALNVCISLFFSLPIFNSNHDVLENIVASFRSTKALVLFLLVFLIYLRIIWLVFGRLNHEFLIAALGFGVMMSIPWIAEGMPMLNSWLSGKAVSYSSPLSSTFIIWCFPSYLIAHKLVRQFREAKNKKAVLALTS